MAARTTQSKCLGCDCVFDAPTREVKRGNGKFCSLSCSSSHFNLTRRLSRIPNCECAWCGSKFYRSASKLNNSKSGLQFCNRGCKQRAQKIGGLTAIQPNHYTEERRDYRLTAFETYPHCCNRCGYIKVKEVLQVHHKDCDHSNNTVDNLEILCPNCHAEEHMGS